MRKKHGVGSKRGKKSDLTSDKHFNRPGIISEVNRGFSISAAKI